MRLKHIIICIVVLLAADAGIAAERSRENVRTESLKKTTESSAVRLYAGNGHDGRGRVSMKCLVARNDTAVVLKACILRGDFAVQVTRAGIRFTLKNGESLALKPERNSCCCSDWAAGRWNNVSLRLSPSDREMLKRNDIVSVCVFTGRDEVLEFDLNPGKQGTVARLLHSVE